MEPNRSTADAGRDTRVRPSERLTNALDFKAAFQRGQRCDGPLFLLIGSAGREASSRLGLAVTRRVGGAVARNRAKRRLRECFRRNKPARPLDVVLVAKRELLDAKQAELEGEYKRRVARLVRRLVSSSRPNTPARD